MRELDLEEKKDLLRIARESLIHYFREKESILVEPSREILREIGGAFVTLTNQGQLRGCIGNPVSTSPLYEVVSRCALAAAVRDTRFSAVSAKELPTMEIEISVLSPMQEIRSVEEIYPGRHGLLIRKGHQSGLLLPQVAIKYGWDRETFLCETCYKAGLPKDEWKKGAHIQIFTAQVFSQKELE